MELTEQISRNNYYSFLWHAVFLALTINFMDMDTIIPAMMVDAGASPLQLGFLTAIMVGGARFAQLFFGPFLNNRSSKKGYLLGGINTRILSLAGMALLFYFSASIKGSVIILAIFFLISLFSFSGSFANINYVDILGKSVLEHKRKAFFSIKHVLSNIFVFLSAFLAKKVLTTYGYPMNYVTLFTIAAVLLAIASLGFWKIKEIPASNNKIEGMRKFIKIITQEIITNKKLRNYLLLINTQGICLALMPFLILYARNIFAAGNQDVGNFLIFKVIGGILTGSLLFYFSSKIKYHYMMQIASALGIIIPLLMLMLPGAVLFPYIFLLGGMLFTIHTVSMNGILLEVTTNENRALYTGLSGAGGIVPVIFPFLSGWIITVFGFTQFFILFMLIIFSSLYFIYRIECKK